ncbi:MAG TPA: GAF and ANTAR domain-containing protein [Amycolatopsis sp.]|nr:GAF and ANTAR domain-containing protein [Amycolatopsis sp.]
MRDEALADALVELAETLTGDFDVIDFFHLVAARCVELADAGAAGVLLAHPHGRLEVVASADEEPAIVELFQMQVQDGPGFEAWRTGTPVEHPDLAETLWPKLAEKARSAGFTAACALPMRLRTENIGVLVLLTGPGRFDGESVRAAKAIVDVATIGLLQARAVRRQEVLIEQLQHALTSRVVIEQAKGFVAERLGVGMATAFARLRDYARRHSLRLTDVAEAVVTRSEEVRDLFADRPAEAEHH